MGGGREGGNDDNICVERKFPGTFLRFFFVDSLSTTVPSVSTVYISLKQISQTERETSSREFFPRNNVS